MVDLITSFKEVYYVLNQVFIGPARMKKKTQAWYRPKLIFTFSFIKTPHEKTFIHRKFLKQYVAHGKESYIKNVRQFTLKFAAYNKFSFNLKLRLYIKLRWYLQQYPQLRLCCYQTCGNDPLIINNWILLTTKTRNAITKHYLLNKKIAKKMAENWQITGIGRNGDVPRDENY